MKKLLGKATIAFAVLTLTLSFGGITFAATTVPTYTEYSADKVADSGFSLQYDFSGAAKLMDTTKEDDATQDYYSLDNKTWLKVVGPLDITDLIVASTATPKYVYYKEDINQVDPYIIHIPTKAAAPDKSIFYVGDYHDNTLTLVNGSNVKVKINKNIVTLNKGDSVSLDGAQSGLTYWMGFDNKTKTPETATGTYTITTQAAAPSVKYVAPKGTAAATLSGYDPSKMECRYITKSGSSDEWGTWSEWGTPLAVNVAARLNSAETQAFYRYEFRVSATPTTTKKPYSKSCFVDSTGIVNGTDVSYDSDSDMLKLTGINSSMEYAVDTAKAGKVTVGKTATTWTRIDPNKIINDSEYDITNSGVLVTAKDAGNTVMNVYIRQAVTAGSNVTGAYRNITTIPVQFRGTAPTITYAAGKYNLTGGTGYEYKTVASGQLASEQGWSTVDGTSIALNEDNFNKTIYIRATAGETTYPSVATPKLPYTDKDVIKGLKVPAKPALTNANINYLKETVVGITSTMEYAIQTGTTAVKDADYMPVEGTDPFDIAGNSAFGKKLYVRVAATFNGAVTLPSPATVLTIPARPAKLTSANVMANFALDAKSITITGAKTTPSTEYAYLNGVIPVQDYGTLNLSKTGAGRLDVSELLTVNKLGVTDVCIRYQAVQSKSFASDPYVVNIQKGSVSMADMGVVVDYTNKIIKNLKPSMEYVFVPAGQLAQGAPAFTAVKASNVVKASQVGGEEGFTKADVGTAYINLDAVNYGQIFAVRYARTVAAPPSSTVQYQIANAVTLGDVTGLTTTIGNVRVAATGTSASNLLSALTAVTQLSNVKSNFGDQYLAFKADIYAACNTSFTTAAEAQVVLGKLQNVINKVNDIASAPLVVTGMTIDRTASVNVNGTLTLTPTITPTGATATVVWKSGTPSVAKVDSTTGVITGVTAGTAVITATTTDGKFSSSCTVTVVSSTYPDANIKSITIGKTFIGTFTVSAVVKAGVAVDSVTYGGEKMLPKEGTTDTFVYTVNGNAPAETDAVAIQAVYSKVVVHVASTGTLPEHVTSIKSTQFLSVYVISIVVDPLFASKVDTVTYDGQPAIEKEGIPGTYICTVGDAPVAATLYSKVKVNWKTVEPVSLIDAVNSHVADLTSIGGNPTAYIFLKPGVDMSSVTSITINSTPTPFTLTNANYVASSGCYVKQLPGVVKGSATTMSVTVTTAAGSDTQNVPFLVL